MSVASKLIKFGKVETPTLDEFQCKLQVDMMELKDKIKKKTKDIIAQRNKLSDQKKLFDDDLVKAEEEKLNVLKEERDELQAEYKDDIEAYKTIEQILKIREEKRTAKASRLYAGLSVLICAGGIGLAYGSDTWATLINKHTMDAVKLAMTRLMPKII